MAEAPARVRAGTAQDEATARSGSGVSRGRRSARAAMDEAFRFTGQGARGLKFERRWTTPGVHPYDEVEWEMRTANISNESGKTVFEQTDVEVPVAWSQLATNVVVSKYFRGHIGTPSARTASSSSSTASSTPSRRGRPPSATSPPTRTSAPSRRS